MVWAEHSKNEASGFSMESQAETGHICTCCDIWHLEVARVVLLSARESEVFLLLGKGKSNRYIAGILSITERTVKAHVARIMTKLCVESRLQAGLVAYSHRMLHQQCSQSDATVDLATKNIRPESSKSNLSLSNLHTKASSY